MKNAAIEKMIRKQYNLSHDHIVKIEFLHCIDNEYHFQVIDFNDISHSVRETKITIKIENKTTLI